MSLVSPGWCRLSHHQHVGVSLSLEEETAKWFPASNAAEEVRDALVAACQRRGAALRYAAGLRGLRQRPGGGWACELEGGGEVLADRVVRAGAPGPRKSTWASEMFGVGGRVPSAWC